MPKANPWKIALFTGQVVSEVVTIDADHDGKMSEQELADTAKDVLDLAADYFPEFVHIKGDPERVKRAAEHIAGFVREIAGA